MSFLDYILAGFGVYEVKEDIIKQNPKLKVPVAKAPQKFFGSTKETISPPISSQKMAIFCPTNLSQVPQIARFLATNQPLLLDVSNLETQTLQRCLDFLCGAKTALEANMKRLENGLFVFVPKGTALVEFLKEEK